LTFSIPPLQSRRSWRPPLHLFIRLCPFLSPCFFAVREPGRGEAPFRICIHMTRYDADPMDHPLYKLHIQRTNHFHVDCSSSFLAPDSSLPPDFEYPLLDFIFLALLSCHSLWTVRHFHLPFPSWAFSGSAWAIPFDRSAFRS